MGLKPLEHQLTEQGLARRPDDDRLGQLLATRVRDYGKFEAETFDMLSLSF